jgi:hypothetical protein
MKHEDMTIATFTKEGAAERRRTTRIPRLYSMFPYWQQSFKELVWVDCVVDPCRLNTF